MSKIIIDNRSSTGDYEATLACVEVIRNGRISGDKDKAQYCYATRIAIIGANDLIIYADKNKCSDRLIVMDDKHAK